MINSNKCIIGITKHFNAKFIRALVGLLIAVAFTGCGSDEDSQSNNSKIGAPMSINGALWKGTVEEKAGAMSTIQIGKVITLGFKGSQIVGEGENIVETTSWSYEISDEGAGAWAILNYTWGKDEITMYFEKPCSGTYTLYESIKASGSSGSVSGPFVLTGLDCTENGRLFANPSKDQWNKTSDERVGNIRFTNNAPYAIDVALWHPDNGSFFAGYHINSGETVLKYGSSSINIGNNWGIQVPGQGVVNVSKKGIFTTDGASSYWTYQFP